MIRSLVRSSSLALRPSIIAKMNPSPILPSLSSIIPSSSRLMHTSSASLSPTKNKSHPSHIIGESSSTTLDLSSAYIGQVIEPPYEITVGESQAGLWSSTFFTHDRIYTSLPFAGSLAFHATPLPFTMMLFKATSMSHVDERLNVLDLSYDHAVYIRPGFVGDTFIQNFTIKHLRNTKDGKSTLMKVGCELFNQKHQLVFSVDKLMLYPNATQLHKLSVEPSTAPDIPRSHVLSHILYHGENALLPHQAHARKSPHLPSSSRHSEPHLAVLRPGSLLLHLDGRPIGQSNNMSLSTLFRWAHPSIYNMKRYKEEDRLVPGGLLIAASVSASSRGLFEILYEEMESAMLINTCAPNDMIGAMSYIKSIKSLKEGFEEVKITTVGVKNVDVATELKDTKVPTQLFLDKNLRPSAIEKLMESECPLLTDKIVAIIHRTIVRQSPYSQQRSIPLL